MSDTIYVRNEEGGVHSVDQEHYDRHLTTTSNAGKTYLLPGWSLISEAEAKAAHPQLFGALDPQITFTDDELGKALARKRARAELYDDDTAS